MSNKPFRLEPLGKQDRSSFSCGVAELDHYLRTQASQDVRRRYATCFVAVDKPTKKVVGYYSLAMSSIPHGEIPDEIAQRLPRYSHVPVARIGRLAVDQSYQGLRLGAALLGDAVARVSTAEVAAYAVVVDTKNPQVSSFYERYGFQWLVQNPHTLFLPMSVAVKTLFA